MKMTTRILLAGCTLALVSALHAQNGSSGEDAAATSNSATEQSATNTSNDEQTNAPAAATEQPAPEMNQMPAEPQPQEPPPQEGDNAPQQPSGPAIIRATPQQPTTLVAPSERVQFAPSGTNKNGTAELRLNFRGAPIEMVLNYLSDAAGFIIELDTPVRGKVDVWSNQPVTKEEAIELLNSVLNKNGYAVIRNGRTLRIMNRDDAIHSDIPVKVSSDPTQIPKTDEIVTQIIPVRFVEARQLVSDLAPMISSRATIVANEAGNSLIITDTQANIRHIAEIVSAIDSSAEAVTEVQVFHLQYHDPVEVANLLTSLFSDQGQGNQSPIRFGGGRGGGGGGRAAFFARMMAARQGGGNNGGGGSTDDRIKKYNRVVAVADQRTSSVVVTAARDLMEQIGDMIKEIDRESSKVGKVSVIHLDNADPQQVQQVLQEMFQTTTTRNNRNNQNSVLMNRGSATQNQTTTTGFGNQGFGGNRGGGGFGQ